MVGIEIKTISVTKKTNRTFSYEKNGIKLDFTLNVDNASDLTVFNAILKQAVVDTDAAIESITKDIHNRR